MKESNQTLTIWVAPANTRPVFKGPILDMSVKEDQTLELDPKEYFNDSESGTNLTFSCNLDNLTVDLNTGAISWIPLDGEQNLTNVIITAFDGNYSEDSNAFNITFIPVNEPPTFQGMLEDVTIYEDHFWTFDLSNYFADEEDAGGLIIESSITGAHGVNVDKAHVAEWDPSGGKNYSIQVHFTAHDAQDYTQTAESNTITLSYVLVDDPPIYNDKLGDESINAGTPWNRTLELYFSDEDTKELIFSVNYPDIMNIIRINQTTHKASWETNESSKNLTGVVFSAYDGTTRVNSSPINLTITHPDKGNGKPQQPIILKILEDLPWYIYFLLPLGIVGGILAIQSYRKVRYGRYEIEQLFLVYNDGRLLAHRQKRMTAQVSNDLLTGMLTALKGFIKESLRDQDKGELDEMKYGDMKIAIEHGKDVYLAAFISGYVTDKLKSEMKTVLRKVETDFEPVLKSWDGMMPSIEGAGLYLDALMGNKGPPDRSQPPAQ